MLLSAATSAAHVLAVPIELTNARVLVKPRNAQQALVSVEAMCYFLPLV
jgi:hypothetical protein